MKSYMESIFKIIRSQEIKLQDWLVERKISKRKKSLSEPVPGGTSWTDSLSDYLAICKLAAEYDDIFGIFKRSKGYRRALEHVTRNQGYEYLKVIKAEGGDLLRFFLFLKFKENDQFGSPITFNYDIGNFSPTTLRYIKVLMDLKNHFDDLTNFDIIEIGGGYGGQYKIISDVFIPKSYAIIDLAIVLPLIQKYLAKLGLENVIYLTPKQVNKDKEYDLVISNYAFSECAKSVQDDYINKILYRSKRGYLTCNYDKPSSPESPYNKKELSQKLSKMHTVEIMEENPKTGTYNFIIKWDSTKRS
jgi:hypothetical protein